jgi:hypothetical protein
MAKRYYPLNPVDAKYAPYGTIVFRNCQYPVGMRDGKNVIRRAYKMARKNGLSRIMAQNVVMMPVIATCQYQFSRDGAM